MMSKAISLTMLASALSLCQSSEPESSQGSDSSQMIYIPELDDSIKEGPYALARAVAGSFATSPDNRETTIIDRRIFIPMRDQEGSWFYSQLNTGDDQKVYRQRFHQLTWADDKRRVVQRSFEPIEPEKFVDLWDNPDAVFDLTLADMKPAPNSECYQIWTKDDDGAWHGIVDPERCVIFSLRRQTTIRIGAEGYYRGDEYGTAESGFDEDMSPIWGSAPGEFITLSRCQSNLCEAEARTLAGRP